MTGASNPLSAKHYSYDALGDMTAKDDIGTMKYGNGTSGLPLHGLVSTSGPTNYTFTYDSNGNMTSGEGRTLTWTSFNKPSNISNSANSVTFSYDSNFERYKEVETTCQD
jgi:YD repeat-containing protein